jgi:hypothetical protein
MGVVAAIKRKRRVPGTEKKTVTQVTFDNSYAAGGEPLTAAQLGLKKVKEAHCDIVHGSEAEGIASSAFYDVATGLIHLQNTKTGKEVVAAVDCSHVIVSVTAYGH